VEVKDLPDSRLGRTSWLWAWFRPAGSHPSDSPLAAGHLLVLSGTGLYWNWSPGREPNGESGVGGSLAVATDGDGQRK